MLISATLVLPAMAADLNRAYLHGLYAHTLGNARLEYYEAYVVTDSREISFNSVPLLLRSLCSEFPKLDTYMVRLFSDPKWAKPQGFDWGLGPKNARDRSELASTYLAEVRPDGAVTIYPYRGTPQVISIGRQWCK